MNNKSNLAEDIKKVNPPKSKNSKKFGNSLSLGQVPLEKHPSAKNLIDANSQKNESKILEDPLKSHLNNEEAESNKISEFNSVKVNLIENKPFNPNENYYEINDNKNMKMQRKEKKEIENKEKNNVYLFNKEQMEIDKEITESMREDAKFEDIQKKFFVLKGSD